MNALHFYDNEFPEKFKNDFTEKLISMLAERTIENPKDHSFKVNPEYVVHCTNFPLYTSTDDVSLLMAEFGEVDYIMELP